VPLKINTKLQKFSWQLIHIFRFRKPVLLALEYEKAILSKNGFLILYWKFTDCGYLHIPAINKCVFKNYGVAVIPLESADDIVIEFCNTWHKQIFKLQLMALDITIKKATATTILLKNFTVTTGFESSCKQIRCYVPSFNTKSHQFSIHPFPFSINETFNLLNQSLTNDYSLLRIPERQ